MLPGLSCSISMGRKLIIRSKLIMRSRTIDKSEDQMVG
jgi:hypothetical protein